MPYDLRNAKKWEKNGIVIKDDPVSVDTFDVISCPSTVTNIPSLEIYLHKFELHPGANAKYEITDKDLYAVPLGYDCIEIINGAVTVTKTDDYKGVKGDPKLAPALPFLIRVKTQGSTTGSKGTQFTVRRLQLSSSMTTIVDIIEDEVEVSYFKNIIGDDYQWTVLERETIYSDDSAFSVTEVSSHGMPISPQQTNPGELLQQLVAKLPPLRATN